MVNKSVTFTSDADVYEEFCIALNLTNETQEAAIESCMRWYIAKTFEKASQDYNLKTITKQNKDTNKDFYGNQINEFQYGQLNRINIIIISS